MKRWIHAASEPKKERVLTFAYSHDNAEADAHRLSSVLNDNGIEHVMYDDFGIFKFIVRRSGRSWNDIMKVINSVKPARYNYTSTSFGYDENGQLHEVVYDTIYASEDSGDAVTVI